MPRFVGFGGGVEGEGVLHGGVVQGVEVEVEEGAEGDEEEAEEEETGVAAQAEFSSHFWVSIKPKENRKLLQCVINFKSNLNNFISNILNYSYLSCNF